METRTADPFERTWRPPTDEERVELARRLGRYVPGTWLGGLVRVALGLGERQADRLRREAEGPVEVVRVEVQAAAWINTAIEERERTLVVEVAPRRLLFLQSWPDLAVRVPRRLEVARTCLGCVLSVRGVGEETVEPRRLDFPAATLTPEEAALEELGIDTGIQAPGEELTVVLGSQEGRMIPGTIERLEQDSQRWSGSALRVYRGWVERPYVGRPPRLPAPLRLLGAVWVEARFGVAPLEEVRRRVADLPRSVRDGALAELEATGQVARVEGGLRPVVEPPAAFYLD